MFKLYNFIKGFNENDLFNAKIKLDRLKNGKPCEIIYITASEMSAIKYIKKVGKNA